MGIAELERRVVHLAALIKCQRRLIGNLQGQGKDPTSAKLVFDGMRVGFFLAAQDWYRARCYGDPVESQSCFRFPASTWGANSGIFAVSHLSLLSELGKWTASDISTVEEQIASNHAKGGTRSEFGRATSWGETKRYFGMGVSPPHRRREKEFQNSLDAEGRRLLEELAGKSNSF